jgi:mannose-6-phosphate isomerase-like protein (cupin superfamily)
MSHPDATDIKSGIRAAQIVAPCADVTECLNFLVDALGFKVNFISPADAPSVAVLSGHGATLRLEQTDKRPVPVTLLRLMCDATDLPRGAPEDIVGPDGLRVRLSAARPPVEIPEGRQSFVLTAMAGDGAWGTGRAGMLYRDLIPDRLGGRFIASHIRIPTGGPVPDYVHYHRIRFQMIFCRTGWAKLVYEDQGQPFLMKAGDCVLQPPEIRHRVLEASSGLEVIEIGCPAVHETHADHVLLLPTGRVLPERDFGGQRFQRHVAAQTPWGQWRAPGFEARDTGIGEATHGQAGARVARPTSLAKADALGARPSASFAPHGGEFLFFFALQGAVHIEVDGHGRHRLESGASCVIPVDAAYVIDADRDLELLEVSLPADIAGKAR